MDTLIKVSQHSWRDRCGYLKSELPVDSDASRALFHESDDFITTRSRQFHIPFERLIHCPRLPFVEVRFLLYNIRSPRFFTRPPVPLGQKHCTQYLFPLYHHPLLGCTNTLHDSLSFFSAPNLILLIWSPAPADFLRNGSDGYSVARTRIHTTIFSIRTL